MAGTVDFQNVIPSRMFVDPPVSSSKMILNKYETIINPVDQTEYDTRGNKIIVFYVSSDEAFLHGPESYIQMKLSISDYDGAAYVPYFQDVVFGAAGYESLFRNIKLYAADSGELIEKIDYSNLVAAWKKWRHPEPLHDGEGSVNLPTNTLHLMDDTDSAKALSGTGFVFTKNEISTVKFGKLIGAETKFLTEMKPGHVVIAPGGIKVQIVYVQNDVTAHFNYLTSPPLTAAPESLVQSVFSAWVVRFEEFTNVVTGDADVGGFFTVANYSAWKDSNGSRGPQCLESTKYINFKIPFELFKFQIPLFLFAGGIRMEFELDIETNIFHDSRNPAFTEIDTLKIKISEVSMKAVMIIAHEQIVNEYLKDFRSSGGILYRLPQVRVRRVAGQASESSTTITTTCGARSVKRVSCIVRDSEMFDKNGKLAASNDTLSTWLRTFITKYTFRVGSDNYPYHGVRYNEIKKHNSIVFDKPFTDNYQKRFQFCYTYLDGNVTSTNIGLNEDADFIMCASLARDNSITGDLTGVNLTSLNLELEIERSTNYSPTYKGNPMYFFFIEYDSYLRLTPSGITILQ